MQLSAYLRWRRGIWASWLAPHAAGKAVAAQLQYLWRLCGLQYSSAQPQGWPASSYMLAGMPVIS